MFSLAIKNPLGSIIFVETQSITQPTVTFASVISITQTSPLVDNFTTVEFEQHCLWFVHEPKSTKQLIYFLLRWRN